MILEPKFTTGPWVAVGPMVEHPNDAVADICTCNPDVFLQSILRRSHAETCANARVIAQAPRMVDLLRAARHALAAGTVCHDLVDKIDTVLEEVDR
jgi:hypothetical protein